MSLEELLLEIRNNNQFSQSEADKATKRHDEIIKKFDEVNVRINGIENRVVKLENSNLSRDSEMTVVKCDLNQLKQEKIINELIVRNVPELNSESEDECKHLVVKILEKLNLTQNIQVKLAKRVGKSVDDKPRPIIFEVLDIELKQKILENKRKVIITTKQLNLGDVSTNDSNVNIYINENLTKMNRMLYKQARDWKREKLVKYTWSINGIIYVRQDDKSKAISLRGELDIINCRNKFKNRPRDPEPEGNDGNLRKQYVTRNAIKNMGLNENGQNNGRDK